MTGAADLDALGTWQRGEGGWRWLPPVPATWAPFHDGRWAWVPPWGWTWVDNARWGFAPFHYGRWSSAGGRWAWVPGAANAAAAPTAPTFAPALVAWVAAPADGTAGPTRPTWVPLAPDEPVFVAAAVSPAYWQRLNPGIPYPHAAPATGAERLVPSGPARLANGAAKGALTMLGADTLQPWQTVTLAGAKDAMPFAAALSSGRVSWVAPPGPPTGRGAIDGSIGAVTVRVPERSAAGAAPAASR
jgi:hypothetical protein